jgi:NAD(P)-dependent dehydrogenase (short-subunit alcohol dehydrogenase family)
MKEYMPHLTMTDLTGKVAIVTGAGRGLGKWIARGLVSAGANLVITSRNKEECEIVASQLKTKCREAIDVQSDVTQIRDLVKLVKVSIKAFDQIDILVNNAGVIVNRKFKEVAEQDYDYVMNTNLKGVYFCSQVVAREMMRRKKGK